MRIKRAGAVAAIAAASVLALAMTFVTHSGSAEADVNEQVIFAKGDAGYGCFRIPAIVRAGNDDLIAFAEGRNSADCGDVGDIDLVMRRSADDGRTWGDIEVVNGGSENNWANPVPILDEESGRLVLVTVHNPAGDSRPRIPHVQTSDDDGNTWTEPRSLETDLAELGEWGHFASGPGGGIQLTRGENAGRLVVGINYSVTEEDHAAGLIYSDDQGESWQVGAQDVIDGGAIIPQELSLVELTDGGIYAVARENGNPDPANPVRAVAVGEPGGESWAAPFEAEPDLPGTKQVQGSALRLRASDTGDAYDRIIFAAPTYGTLRKDMTIRSSFDEGGTWQTVSEGTQITDSRAGYSNMTLLANGEIGLVYEGGAYPDGDANDTIRFASFTEEDLGLPDN
ncbi:MAG: sialidase family protein [Stackebrandtia sp.]